MAKLYNLARMTTATTSTGTITLGSAVSGYLTFALAGVASGDVVSYGIKDGANSEIGTGTYTSAGTTLTRTVTASTNSNTAINLSGTAEVFITPRAEDLITSVLHRSYLAGLTLSAAGSTATFGVAAGVATDSTNVAMMALASAYTKTTSAWAVGTGNGALDTGAIATNTWYHVHLIQRVDTGLVDVLVSLSVASPTMPTNYTLFRRIGSMKTNSSSQWIKFIQNGDEFIWDVPVTDVSNFALTATVANQTLTVPTGIKVTVSLSVAYTNTGIAGFQALIYSLETGTQAAGVPTANWTLNCQVANQYCANQVKLLTNTSAQVAAVSGTATNNSLYIVTTGWYDRRGRDA